MHIFYSWQSDLSNSTNRSLIEKALYDAAKTIAKDETLQVQPVVDRDVAGSPGSPNIAETILKKIDETDLFVCDVTIITPSGAKRPCPNPNVIFELGYALRTLGEERILMVMNTAFGSPEKLPFDLKMKSVIRFKTDAAADNASVRKELQLRLTRALELILKKNPPKPTQNKISDHDMTLFQQLRSDLPSNGSIRFIDTHNMAGWTFQSKKLDDLVRFDALWNDAEHEFLDPEMEKLRQRLFKLVREYLKEVVRNTVPTHTKGWVSVPQEWEEKQPTRFHDAVTMLHEKAGEIVQLHKQFLRVGIRKCSIAAPKKK